MTKAELENLATSTMLRIKTGEHKGRIVVLDGTDLEWNEPPTRHKTVAVVFVGGVLDVSWVYVPSALEIATLEMIRERKRQLSKKLINIAHGETSSDDGMELATDGLELMMFYKNWRIHDHPGINPATL